MRAKAVSSLFTGMVLFIAVYMPTPLLAFYIWKWLCKDKGGVK